MRGVLAKVSGKNEISPVTSFRMSVSILFFFLFFLLFSFISFVHICSASRITAGKATGTLGSGPWIELHGVGSATFDDYHILCLEELN